MLALVLVFVSFILFWLKLSVTKPRNFPPGPKWLPMVGSLPFLKRLSIKLGSQHRALTEMSKQFKTNVLGLKLGGEIMISVEDYETIREVLTCEQYDQRPNNFFIRLRTLGTCKGITCAEGKLWTEQRSFVVRHLRNIGLGKKIMDLKIQDEIANLFKIIDERVEVQIAKLLPFAIINILWSMVAGKRIASENQLLDIINKRTKAFDMSGGVLAQQPWLRYIIPERSGYNLIKKLNKELKAFLMETINEHHETWTEDNQEDFIYSFITEMKKMNDPQSSFTDEQLLIVCLDLFVGGFTTTSSTLDFFFLMMVLYPDVQAKIQANLDETFDDNYQIEFTDRHRLPYIDAVIKEVQRYRTILPVIGPRRSTKEMNLSGYTIPKDTTILINLAPTYMSKEIWGDPENFRPERFLDESGELVSHPQFLPFGLGKRKCLGDAFARGCLFIFTTEFLRRYEIRPVDEKNLPSAEPLPGLVASPRPYFAKFTRRRQ
ncbi:hypothetical protein PPYR_14106 [Photinus pyralis]|uniref:Cytochrome P450 n=1 Tax=Photinus pyralis TaxID=7054 RepID=A0A5N4A4B1_PHOPY|nr:probable cytochrome P450 305a1 isoform X1 [Photinus pyralis]XP_031356618.1 probable cytochrome P450 305a1 isoform X2 [Photinus pyralis]KAB0792147.1 hypothetical protein PPYR_14106 [Photinus pyralis]